MTLPETLELEPLTGFANIGGKGAHAEVVAMNALLLKRTPLAGIRVFRPGSATTSGAEHHG